jgi:hypothetical protein
MTTTTAEVHNPYLTDAHDTLKALHGYALREVFTAGLAAGRNRDRAAVDNAISRLTEWSEHLVYCASIRDTTDNLSDAADVARAARIVWCCYLYLPPAPGAVLLDVTATTTTRLVRVHCPHCHKVHTHGWPFGEQTIGHRSSHCAGGRGGYVIPTPEAGTR